MYKSLVILLQRVVLPLVIILTAFVPGFVYGEVVETPFDMFSLEDNVVSNSNITIRVVKNIEETCRKNRRKSLHQITSKNVEACSTWSFSGGQSICIIFASKDIDYWILGHEVRHCFQGNFHD